MVELDDEAAEMCESWITIGEDPQEIECDRTLDHKGKHRAIITTWVEDRFIDVALAWVEPEEKPSIHLVKN